jgi:hypothetical protein
MSRLPIFGVVVSLGEGARPLAKRIEAAMPKLLTSAPQGKGKLIVIDGAAETSEADRTMLQTARQEGSLFVLQNARAEDMTQGLGLPFGFAARLCVVRATADGRGAHVTVLKPFAEVRTGEVEERTIAGAPPQPTKEELARIAESQSLAESEAVLEDEDQDTAQQVMRLLSDDSWHQQFETRSAAPHAGKAGNRAWVTVVIPTETWHAKDGKRKQTAKVWGSWDIQMCACPDATGKPGKYVFITTQESGANSGNMLKDEPLVRCFFTEEVTLAVRPVQKKGDKYFAASLPHGSTLAVAPKTENSKNQYTATTGWHVKAGQSKETSIEVGFSSQQQTTRQIPDFRVINNSDGTAARWTFRVAFAEDTPYNTYQDLYNWFYIRKLPALATSSCTGTTEAVYFFPAGDNSRITLEFSVEHVLRSCWFHGTNSATKPQMYKAQTYQTLDLGEVSP